MRRGHAQGLGELEGLERELPGTATKTSMRVAAAERDAPGLGPDCYGVGRSGTPSS